MFRASSSRSASPSTSPCLTLRPHPLDEEFHAPLSLRRLNELCAGDAQKIEEAIDAASEAVNARLKFWDGVLEAIKSLSAKNGREISRPGIRQFLR